MTGRQRGGPAPPAEEELDFHRRIWAAQAEARRREAVRRRRRQALPAVLAGSATLAGVGLTVAWVSARLPTTPPVSLRMPSQAVQTDQARVAALQRELAQDQSALTALMAAASAAGAPTASIPPAPRTVVTAAPVKPASPPPATHASTGASGAR